jgi:hypothetical protein
LYILTVKIKIYIFLLTYFIICVWSLVIKLSVHSLKILVGCFAKNGRMHLSLSDRSNMFWLTLQFNSVQLCSVWGRNQFKSWTAFWSYIDYRIDRTQQKGNWILRKRFYWWKQTSLEYDSRNSKKTLIVDNSKVEVK